MQALRIATQPTGPIPSGLQLGVSEISAHVTLWNAKAFTASFYLRLAATSSGYESLGERLNSPATKFLPCKLDVRVDLVNLMTISHVRVLETLPEVDLLRQLGATCRPARVMMKSGYTLTGEFLYIQPSSRSRLSDFLNLSDERFLLLLTASGPVYLNRDEIVRVVS